jgi:hypothetical protein
LIMLSIWVHSSGSQFEHRPRSARVVPKGAQSGATIERWSRAVSASS